MKKGFTLVELLAVIVILGIIAVITIPKIQEVLYGSQDEAYNFLVSRIEDKVSAYVSDNNLGSQVTEYNPLNVYLSQLISGGYIELKDLEDPREKGNHIDENNSYVRLTLENGNLVYTSYFTSITGETTTDDVLPTIVFGTNGNTTYAKSRSTTVTVTDNGSGINAGSLKYLWNTSTTTPAETSITTSFTNGNAISTPAGVTGGYYLWILAKDNNDNTLIERTNVFNLDNTRPVITLTGSTSISIILGSTYTDAGATATDNISTGLTPTATSTVNVNVAGTYTVTYNVSDGLGNAATPAVRTVIVQSFAGPGYITSEGVNGPVLASGMTPVKWNGSAWATTTVGDAAWYNYTNKEWANAQTADGSMWVWIPRYVYRISTGWHTSTVGTIDVQFSMGTDDTRGGTVTLDLGTTSNASNNKWTNHPAFTFGTTELTGIWVAKFEASGTTAAIDIKPNVAAIHATSIGTMFTATRSMETNSRYGWGTSGTGIDTHLMKNVEWGANAYLSKSTYGKNAEIWINNSSIYTTGCAGDSVSAAYYNGCQNAYNTANGMQASTTGNIYGIYDISGGTWEYTSAYVSNGNSNLTSYGGSIVSADSKYRDAYTVTTDDQSTNYNNAINKKGDAVYETSSTSGGYSAWYGDYAYMPNVGNSWFIRGDSFYNDVNAGAFLFYGTTGCGDGSYIAGGVGFRPVISAGTGL